MNRKIVRVLAGVLCLGLLATTFAMPAEAKTKKKSAKTAVAPKGFEYIYHLPVSALSNHGTIIGCDIGNLQPLKYSIGGGLVGVNSFNFGNQYSATATYTEGSALPYSRVSTVDATIRPILDNAARSMGYTPGGMFDLEIGAFTNYAGYAIAPRLNNAQHYELSVWPIAGFSPRVMVLLPDGTFRMLNDSELDRSRESLMFVDGTRLYTLHTYFPKAIYMLVYVPQ